LTVQSTECSGLQPAALARRFRIAFYVRERSFAAKMSAGAFENAGNVRYDQEFQRRPGNAGQIQACKSSESVFERSGYRFA